MSKVQLLAKGPQEVQYLNTTTNLTDGSLFYNTHKRHTPFDTVPKTEHVIGAVQWGNINTFPIDIRGDVLGNAYLQVTLPAVQGSTRTWVPNIGRVLIRRFKVLINGDVVADTERLWIDLVEKCFSSSMALNGMMKRSSAGLSLSIPHIITIPIPLLDATSHNTPSFLPLAALSRSTIRLEIDTESFEKCLAPPSSHDGTDPFQALPPLPPTLDMVLVAEYTTVDAPERMAMRSNPIDTLYTTVQDMESSATPGSPNVVIDLSELNHSVKAFVIVAYPRLVTVSNYFEYSDVIASMALRIDNHDIVESRPAHYFRDMHRYASFPKTSPNDNIHVISMALTPKTYQPTGSINFSKIRQPLLYVAVHPTITEEHTVKVFAICIRRLRISGGQGCSATCA
jgi:hypothetical protein